MAENTTLQLLPKIVQAIHDKKGRNILTLDVQGICSMTDYFVIAEANVDRHARAIAQDIEEVLEEFGEEPLHITGREHGDWIVLDYVTVIIHLFVGELRDFYRLEELWKEGKVLDIPLEDDSN